MKNKILTILTALFTASAQAQDAAGSETMASTMRSNGKIYVVVAVVITILFGLIAYVIRLDRKVSRLEKES
ncbi:MAG: CcmD family protein [Bacteroidetes bacterium]|nr:CcmD family protein [Bacteroidota bacterium]